MLTPIERHAARTAPFRLGLGHGYGTPALGYCPIGAVAVARGVQFETDPDGEYSGYRVWMPAAPHDRLWDAARDHLRRATEDILTWGGYPTLAAFLRAWEAHGAACFPEETACA